jgi:hypothetical protein
VQTEPGDLAGFFLFLEVHMSNYPHDPHFEQLAQLIGRALALKWINTNKFEKPVRPKAKEQPCVNDRRSEGPRSP